MTEDLEAWRKTGKHLPKFMRDFHSQKELFKWLDEAARDQNERLTGSSHPDFKSAMCYTIDIFLWIMAAHGWTLQRSKKKGLPFRNVSTAVHASTERRHNAFFNAMLEALNERKQK